MKCEGKEETKKRRKKERKKKKNPKEKLATLARQLRKIDFKEKKMSKDETYFILRRRKVGQFFTLQQ